MQKVQYIEISKLKLHSENPRKIDEKQFEILRKSIKENPEFFEARPILCNKNMEVFAGNMRLRAASMNGLEKVPCIIMDVSKEKEKELMLRDNKPNGEWDYDLLASLFELPELADIGFTAKDLSVFDIEGLEPEEKEKKEKLCPHCGVKL